MKIHKYSLNQIKTLIVESTELLVITSPTGSDESALSNQLASISNSNWNISQIQASHDTSIDSLCHDILSQALSEKINDKIPLVSQVHKYLQYSALNQTIPIVIITSAHDLPIKTLEFVLQISELRYAETLFRLVFFADDTINDRLDDPKIKDLTTGVIRNIQIPSSSFEETKEHMDDQHSSSNKIVEDIITDLEIEEHVETDTAKSLHGLIIIVIGLISIIAVYLFFNNQKIAEITDSYLAIPTESQQASTEESPSQIELPTTQDQDIALEEEDQELEDSNEIVNEGDAIVETQPSLIESESEIDNEILDLQAEETGEFIEEIPFVELPEYIEEIEHPIIVEEEEKLTEEIESENTFNLETTPDFLAGIKGPHWLRQQPADSYVLQLISAQYKSNLRNLLSGQPGIQTKLSGYVKYTPSGIPRYLLLYGLYPNGKAAQKALDDLPAELKATNPWSRTINDVIKELDTVSAPTSATDEEIPVNIEVIEHPIIVEEEEKLTEEIESENTFNLETIPDFLAGIKGPHWLRQQPADSYVLQLISAQYKSNLRNLLSGQPGIQAKLSGYVKYTPSGIPRYLLLYGLYPSGKAAEAAIDDLPVELQSINPWPRTIDDVINELDTISGFG